MQNCQLEVRAKSSRNPPRTKNPKQDVCRLSLTERSWSTVTE